MAMEKAKERQENAAKKPHLSVEQKLALSHMIRQEQDYNRLQMDQRERYVYGTFPRRKKPAKSGRYPDSGMLRAAQEEERREEAWEKEQKRFRISLLARGFFTILLLVIVLLMRFENLSIGGVDYQNLIDSLQSREFIKGIDFDELMPYTEKEDEA